MEINHFHPRHEKYVTVLSQISKMDRMGGKPSAHPIPQADIRSLRLLMSYALQMRLCASTAALAGLAAQKAVLSGLAAHSPDVTLWEITDYNGIHDSSQSCARLKTAAKIQVLTLFPEILFMTSQYIRYIMMNRNNYTWRIIRQV